MTQKRILIPHRIIPHELYVLRDADRQLESILSDMASPGYVLVSRQMGKTNLLLNAKRSYQTINDVYIYIDLSNAFHSELECFRNIIDKSIDTHQPQLKGLNEGIRLIRDEGMPPHLEHLKELRLILNHISGKMVIILDEIDALTRASFSDKIFSQIRSIYFERDSYPELKRLTYILSGVVEPTEIIRDSKISPFNIGQKIFLDDFSFDEHLIFLSKASLDLKPNIVERVYFWTSGNPRMTYDICSEIERKIIDKTVLTTEMVDDVIEELYLKNFDKAPIDHIRELVADNKAIRDAITIIRYGKGSQIEHNIKTRLYLAGIINSDFTAKSLGIKNKIIDESLSESWIKTIEKQSKGINDLIQESIIAKDYKKVIELYSHFDESTDESLTNSSFYNVGLSYSKTAGFDKAIQAFEYVHYNSNYERSAYLDTKFLLAESYFYNNNSEKAIEIFNEIIVLDTHGKYYFPSTLLLANIYIEFEKGRNIDKAIEYFTEILNEQGQLEKDFDIEYSNNIRASAYLNYGRALSKLKLFDQAKEQFDLAFTLAQPFGKPLILLGQYNLENDHQKKSVILNQIVDIIISSHLIPNPDSIHYTYFSHQTLYKIIAEVFYALEERFNEFCKYLFKAFEAIKSLEYGEGLYNMVYIATTNQNRDLAVAICEILVLEENSLKIGSDYTYACFKIILSSNLLDDSKQQLYMDKFYKFLSINKRFVLNSFDLDVLMEFADRQIVKQNYKHVQSVVNFMYSSLEKAVDNLKTSKYLIEFIEIKALHSAEFVEAAQHRSKSLLSNISKLSSQDIVNNPLLKSSIDIVKNSLFILSHPASRLKEEPTFYKDNERVNVKYKGGSVLKNIKYKKVKDDIASKKCDIY